MNHEILIGVLGVAGSIASAIGVIIAIIQIQKVRKVQLKETIKDAFELVSTTSSPFIAPYVDIYKYILKYYGLLKSEVDEKRNRIDTQDDYILTEKNYLNSCILHDKSFKIQFLKKDESYFFPVLTKKGYLKSRNKRFSVKVSSIKILESYQQTSINSRSLEFLKHFDIADFANYLARKGRNIWNASTFEVSSLDEESGVVGIDFVLGSYHNFVNNNEIVLKETYFAHYVNSNKQFKSRSINRILPSENLIRKGISFEKIFDFRDRPTSIGFSAFIVMYKGDGKFSTVIQRRSSNQVEYPGFYHVAPAGTFQPLSEFDTEIIEQQCDLNYTVLREFLEEVFNLEAADKNKSVDPYDIFRLKIQKDDQEFSPGKELGIGIKIKGENEKYSIIPTSFAVDLMTLKPHISFVLEIKDESFYQNAIKVMMGNWEGKIKEFDIDSSEFHRFIERNLNINGFPPVGAITLLEGLNYYSNAIKPKY